MTVTQTIVQERLQPSVPVTPQTMNMVTKPPLPSVLLRSSSFDKLKNLPSSLHAYFCRHGSTEILKWLIYSRTQIYATLSQIHLQLRSLLLISSVYAAVGLISIQFAMCIAALATVTLPAGLAFLLTCIAVMAALAVKLNLLSSRRKTDSPRRQSRSRTRHVKQE